MKTNTVGYTHEISLVREAQGGSKEAFCELYDLYKDKLYRYALYKLGCPEDAEDAVSECVLAAWQSLPQLRNEAAFGSWIFRILHNCCVRHISEAVSMRENMQSIYESGHASGSADGPEHTQMSAELNEALAILSENERSIVLLSVIGGLSSRDISDITALTPGSVRSSLSRSLAKMRDFLS